MSITMQAADPIPGTAPDGRPDPAYAAALGLVAAPAGRRAAAFTIDAVVWVLVAVPAVVGSVQLVAAVSASGAGAVPTATDAPALVGPLVLVGVGQLLVGVLGIVQLTLHGRRGVTIGKASCGLRSVDVATFERPGFWRVVLRALVLWAAQVVLPLVGPAICFASGRWDQEGRGRSWLDRIGRCWVVDARHGLDPFDARALRHARRQVESVPLAGRASLPSLASARGVDERTFIPAARSSSGVVAAPAALDGVSQAGPGGWTPPPLGTPSAGRASAPASAPAPLPAVMLVFSDGARIAASGTTLLGRGPARAAADPAEVVLVPLVDPSMGLSRTHAAVEVDDRGIRVTDRWSSNGTSLVDAAGVERDLEPGVPHPVPPDSAVRLGGLEFRVEAVGA
ncbi:RDD family protein [Agromyces sp. SYSU T00266]|uniref:RDD family protein n=1 Tax=Agromyces zhanjiangensis TaxID=3158562 RepID=UPI00339986BD